MRFDLEWPEPDVVKYCDRAVFASEKMSGIVTDTDWWVLDEEHPCAWIDVVPWTAGKARASFLNSFAELFGQETHDRLLRP